MRKRTSLRRWKKRCDNGQLIPAQAICDYRLDRWFYFELALYNVDFYYAERK